MTGGSGRLVRRALALAPGSRRLIALRWALVVLSSMPALVVTRVELSRGPALSPYYTDVDGPLPAVPLLRLSGEIPAAIPMALAAMALALLGDQFLTAGAVRVLAGHSSRVRAAVFREARGQFWPLLRLAAMGAIGIAAGTAALAGLGSALRSRGLREGWAGMTQQVRVPMVIVGLILMWSAAVGAWTLWARAMAVADGRRCARRTGWLAFRALMRHPVSGLLLTMLVTLGSLMASGALLAAWFAAEPSATAGVALWSGLWLVGLAVQAYVWHWMLRAACLMESSPRLDDLRCAPDAPFHLLRRAWSRGTRAARRRRPAPESSTVESGTPEGH